MRPAGPVPGTWRRSMPASRARRRTAGDATGLTAPARASARGAAAAPPVVPDAARVWGHGRSCVAVLAFCCAGLRRRCRLGDFRHHLARLRLRCIRASRSPGTFRRTRSDPTATFSPISAPSQMISPSDRRGNFDRRLVGHHRGERRVLAHQVADFDVPFDEFGFGDALADIGQLDHVLRHVTPPWSRAAAPTRAGPGK